MVSGALLPGKALYCFRSTNPQPSIMLAILGSPRKYPSSLRYSPVSCVSPCWHSRTTASVPTLPPRQFPTSGFVRLDLSEKVEKEKLPLYVPEIILPCLYWTSTCIQVPGGLQTWIWNIFYCLALPETTVCIQSEFE